MNKNTIAVKIFVALAAVLIFSCAGQEKIFIDKQHKDGKYDSEFPSVSASDALERISNSIFLVNSLAFYKQFNFRPESKIRYSDLSASSIVANSYSQTNFNKTASGTATVIGATSTKLLLLTCQHIVSFEDTIVVYVQDSSGKATEFIESISFKNKQNNYTNIRGTGETEILFEDVENDIALISNEIVNRDPFAYRIFDYRIGNSDELNWGNFVYTLGYPLHYKMVSRAIVSKPSSDTKNYFIIDAVMNRGASGGLVLAIRDGIPNFELVGIISWVPADKYYFLKPEMSETKMLENQEYRGQEIIGVQENVKYGITKVVSINTIKEFLDKHSNAINKKGFQIFLFN
ncbi:MAG: serine protease [Bacteroidota bacterium]|nr:serine protease [Bacteroidota bacterium]